MAGPQPTCIENEEWRDIPGWEGYYQVSDHGRVRSLSRTITRKDGAIVTHNGRIRKTTLSTRGYPQVTLHSVESDVCRAVHVLVAAAFIRARPEGMHVCHNDGNPLNNSPSNLRYDTPSKNNLDKSRHGTSPEANRTHCSRGHLHEPVNNVRAKLKKGHRDCLACNRARRHILRHPELAGRMQEVSDKYYREIMKGKEV